MRTLVTLLGVMVLLTSCTATSRSSLVVSQTYQQGDRSEYISGPIVTEH